MRRSFFLQKHQILKIKWLAKHCGPDVFLSKQRSFLSNIYIYTLILTLGGEVAADAGCVYPPVALFNEFLPRMLLAFADENEVRLGS